MFSFIYINFDVFNLLASKNYFIKLIVICRTYFTKSNYNNRVHIFIVQVGNLKKNVLCNFMLTKPAMLILRCFNWPVNNLTTFIAHNHNNS